MHGDRVAAQLAWIGSASIRDIVASLGRTEDVRFSPNNRRLAVAGFFKNKIIVFDVSITHSHASKSVTLTGATEISSSSLNYPHGLDFIDDEKIVVANREGDVCVFKIPDAVGKYELAPVTVVRSENISTPGSVAVIKNGGGSYEALVCNNYAHTVTRHLLGGAHSTEAGEVLLKRWLDIPDGICVSEDKRWIAISNHNPHLVLLYENTPSLNGTSRPSCILRCTNYPHGLRFNSDGRFILVADAGSPYVNIYQRDGSGWQGVRYPLLSFRVLSNQDFLRGRHNPQEGGPKGIDISHAANVVVTTCESQPLAFFDLDEILEGACGERPKSNLNWLREQKALEVTFELDQIEYTKDSIKNLEAQLSALRNSKSWRMTAPLRSLLATTDALLGRRR